MSIIKYNNAEIAHAIKDFFIKNDLVGDIFIYYDNKRIKFNNGIAIVEDGYKASNYFEYANDNWVCLTFEGRFNHIINYPSSSYDRRIIDKFEKLLNKMGHYSELGYAWSMNIVPI